MSGKRGAIGSDSTMILSQRRIDLWKAVQRKLAKRVIWHDSFDRPPKLIAGLDVAYQEDNAFASVAVLDYETLEIAESQVARSIVKVPYAASFFAFREVKPLTKVIRKLKKRADIYLINAHGVAHPERCGCASHLGVELDIPTIGVANRAICGALSGSENGKLRYLRDQGEILGASIYASPAANPIFVSIGHRVSLESAIEIVLRSSRGNRMPEPLNIAHRLCNTSRREYATKKSGLQSS
jgi:deoxyribonuclease V